MENKELLRIRRFNKILTQKDTNKGSDNDIDKVKSEKINSRAELERMFSGVHSDNHNDYDVGIVGVTIDRVEAFNTALRSAAEEERNRQFTVMTGSEGHILVSEAIRRELQRLGGMPGYIDIQNEQRS